MLERYNKKIIKFGLACILLGLVAGFFLGTLQDQYVIQQNIEHNTKSFITVGSSIYLIQKMNQSPEAFIIQNERDLYNQSMNESPDQGRGR